MYYVSINVSLAVFNLLPIAPLDGFGIIEFFLPQKILAWYHENQRIISIVMIFLLFLGIFSGPVDFLQRIVYNFIMKITRMPFSFVS
jgi:Zn-dependent protease